MNLFELKLENISKKNNSLLCVGLDTDYQKLLFKTKNIYKSILKFNLNIIEATSDLICCYKINSAFYEAYGEEGIKALKETIKKIPDEIPVILDFKRADIGNTVRLYAKFAFDYLNSDAVTVLPYMGIEAINIFREYKDIYVFVVAISSNFDARFIQEYPSKNPVYLRIMRLCKKTDKYKNTGYVVGATKPEKIKFLREKGFNEIFLIPGIGSQKGDLEKSYMFALSKKGKAIFNISRDIIYQPEKKNYFYKVREKALFYKNKLCLTQ